MIDQPRVSARRRTQAQRRSTTRGQLLDATLACLVEVGYSGTTTLEVERRAGVSRGARIHHFATKQDLLAAAVDHLYTQLSERYDEVFAHVTPEPRDRERVARALKQLWSIHGKPEYTAATELTIAARTDAALRDRLIAVRERHRQLALAAVARAFPSLAERVASSLIETVHAAMLGLLVQQSLEPDNRFEDAVLEHLGTLIVQHLSADAEASA